MDALDRTRELLLLVALTLLGACGADQPQLPKLAPGAVILAFGDSLTHGTGAREDQSYPSVLAARSGFDVVNAGVPGEVTATGLARLPGVLDRAEPKLVILIHGGNDMLRKKSLATAEGNIRAMVHLIRERGAAVAMLGVPKPGLFLGTAEFYTRIAEDHGVPIDTEIIPDLLGDNRFKSDTVHPNAEGYARMAEAVQVLLRESGAL